MSRDMQFYIDGTWVEPASPQPFDLIDPSTEEVFARVPLGSEADVDQAVAAARRAFPAFSRTSPAERRDLLARVAVAYRARSEELARTVSREMGAPLGFARDAHVVSGLAHLETMVGLLEHYPFEQARAGMRLVKEAIGVVGLITPWNWPLNQIACKIVPALAAGCTVVLKPSEMVPLDALIMAEILHEAGVPNGVFNLVNGDGATVGQALASHPDVDMISFTGSCRAGILVAKAAADTVKRVHQELGGKSANIVLPDADLLDAVARGVAGCFSNSGQSCNAPTRMFVPRERHQEAAALAKATAESFVVGAPDAPGTMLGPVVSRRQFDRIQDLIRSGIDEGATLVTGGIGRPVGLNRGYYIRPTVFADVTPGMRIAREEIFGPVLSILPYDSVEQGVALANDTPYGLAAYVQGTDLKQAYAVARELRAGTVYVNNPAWNPSAPFGGYKRSGNGREYAEFGLDEYLELKAMVGDHPN